MTSIVDILQYAVSGIAIGSVYALVALGFTIIFSSTELVNFAQGEFVMMGAMLSYTFAVQLGWPLYLAVPAAAAVSLIAGALLGAFLTRPLRKASPVALIIITVGASMFVQGLAGQFWGKDAVALPAFTDGSPVLLNVVGGEGLPVVILPQQLWVVGLTAVMVLALTLFFNKTLVGKAMRATAANRVGAGLVGISVNKMIIFAFALSAMLGAVAGAAIAPISYGYFNMGTVIGLKGFAAAIIGGLGNFSGSIIAGISLGLLESFGAGYISSQYKDAIAFIVLLAVLFISPEGISVLLRRRGSRR